MKTEIITAIIAASATLGAAYIPIINSAKEAAQSASTEAVSEAKSELLEKIEKIDVVTAGVVNKNGKIVRHSGYPVNVTVDQLGSGSNEVVYNVIFSKPFNSAPIVVAVSDGGDRGAFAEITEINRQGFTVEGRTYSAHGLAKIGFQFIAVQAKDN